MNRNQRGAFFAKRASAWLRSLLSGQHPFIVAFFCLFAIAVAYRVRLAFILYDTEPGATGPMGFLPDASSKLDLAAALFSDVKYAAAWALATYLAFVTLRSLLPHERSRKRIYALLLVSSMFVYAGIHVLHGGTLTYLHSAPTRGLLKYALENSSVTDYAMYTTWGDGMFLAFIGVIYWMNVTRWRALLFASRGALALVAAVALPMSLWANAENERAERLYRQANNEGSAPQIAWPVAWGIKGSPVGHLVQQARTDERPALSGVSPAKEPTVPFAFVDSIAADWNAKPRAEGKDDNLVILQLEAVNAFYALGDNGGEPFMPYLRSLAGKSLQLANHRSSGVDTDRSSFSIHTGLYAVSDPVHFVNRHDLVLPTMFSLLGGNYASFLVTPSDARRYPRGLLQNTGLKEVWDEKTLPLPTYGAAFLRFKDESQAGDYFIEKLKRSPEPFVGLYYPYATHSPYFDYERASGQAEPDSPEGRYRRNLRLVDRLIERINRALEESGRARRTLIVITADHGEAFGEHVDSFGHGMTLFEEAVKVPMLFYQPDRLSPSVVERPTSHVDLVPTILDILDRRYDASRFQGESALRAGSRRYTFMYSSKADLIASVDADGRKVIASGRSARCEVYDLRADPLEKSAERCAESDPQLKALAAFKQRQTGALRAYQSSCMKTKHCGAEPTLAAH